MSYYNGNPRTDSALTLSNVTGFKDYKNNGFSRSQLFAALGYFLTHIIQMYSKRLHNRKKRCSAKNVRTCMCVYVYIYVCTDAYIILFAGCEGRFVYKREYNNFFFRLLFMFLLFSFCFHISFFIGSSEFWVSVHCFNSPNDRSVIIRT